MHHFPVRIYYEDTDHSGRVYHANYLKYFERAREHVLGAEELVRLYREEGFGFVVYKVELSFREGAIFGDELDIRSDVRRESDWRIRFLQQAWRPGGTQAAVDGVVELVCVDRDHRLVKLPDSIRSRF